MISTADILHGKILIVDDQKANVLLLERMLRGAGYTSIASTMDPREVMELHRKNRYDLILLDVEMPGMDGFQVMEGIKEIEPQDLLVELTLKHRLQMEEGLKETEPGGLPVVVITAHPGHKLRALQAGVKDFISKPFDLDEVLARLRNMMEVRLTHVNAQNYIKALQHKIEEIEGSRDPVNSHSDEVDRPCATCCIEREIRPANPNTIEQPTRHTDMRLKTAVNGNNGILRNGSPHDKRN